MTCGVVNSLLSTLDADSVEPPSPSESGSILIIQRTESSGGVPPRRPPPSGSGALTDVNVAIFVEPVDDEGEDEADVAGVVVS